MLSCCRRRKMNNSNFIKAIRRKKQSRGWSWWTSGDQKRQLQSETRQLWQWTQWSQPPTWQKHKKRSSKVRLLLEHPSSLSKLQRQCVVSFQPHCQLSAADNKCADETDHRGNANFKSQQLWRWKNRFPTNPLSAEIFRSPILILVFYCQNWSQNVTF